MKKSDASSNLDQGVCLNCGAPNGCELAASQEVSSFSCWCQDLDLTAIEREKLKSLTDSPSCLCRNCILDILAHSS